MAVLAVMVTSAGGCDRTNVTNGPNGQGGSAVGGQTRGGLAGQPGGAGQAGGGGQAGSADGNGLGGTGAGGATAVVVAGDVREVIVEDQGGGFTGPAPVGSECERGVLKYTITFGENSLAWHVCTEGDVFTFLDGSRSLKNSELAERLYDALRAVVVSSSTVCGADKSTRLMTVTRATGSVVYLDSFYACQNRGIYVDGIDNVITAAADLVAHPSL